MSSSSAAENPVPAEKPAGSTCPEENPGAEQSSSTSSASTSASASASASTPAPELPPLSREEFKEYNRLAEHMDLFHNHFRQTWAMLYNACVNKKRPASMTLRQFIDEGLYFIRGLTTHHGIEEAYFFPLLATRMPEFRSGKEGGRGGKKTKEEAEAAELLRQHREIHAGMDVLEDYLRRCRRGETELDLAVLREKMDSWGDVLWRHLDQEVRTLGAENMRRYWSLEEMRSLHV